MHGLLKKLVYMHDTEQHPETKKHPISKGMKVMVFSTFAKFLVSQFNVAIRRAAQRFS